MDGSLSAAAGQLLDLYYSAKDLSADLINRLDGYDTNDAELDEIEQRIDRIYKLKRKYGDTNSCKRKSTGFMCWRGIRPRR